MRTNGQGRDNPIAAMIAAKLHRMNAEQQIPGARGIPVAFLAGPEGVAVAKEHGELGILQNFVPGQGPPMIGGGRVSGSARSAEPNTTGLTDITAQLLASEQLLGMRI
jgi:hypothetical protein